MRGQVSQGSFGEESAGNSARHFRRRCLYGASESQFLSMGFPNSCPLTRIALGLMQPRSQSSAERVGVKSAWRKNEGGYFIDGSPLSSPDPMPIATSPSSSPPPSLLPPSPLQHRPDGQGPSGSRTACRKRDPVDGVETESTRCSWPNPFDFGPGTEEASSGPEATRTCFASGLKKERS